MNITITSVKAGQFSTFVAFRADGVRHTALIYPADRASESCLFAFGAEGDDCITTHRIENPDMLAAVTALVS